MINEDQGLFILSEAKAWAERMNLKLVCLSIQYSVSMNFLILLLLIRCMFIALFKFKTWLKWSIPSIRFIGATEYIPLENGFRW
ncbi:hypothetical protein AYI87_15925 [Shewanella sp. KCT]|nr:hypothetical protein AYI87_15925 [Shewanella sp. KCT]